MLDQSMKKKRLGISLIELMLSLLVIVFIALATTRYFQVANENLKVTQAEEMINNIVDASYQWLKGNPDFSTISLTTLQNAGYISTSYTTNPWKGTVVVGPGSDVSKVNLQMSGIPVASCQNLAEKMQKYSTDANCAFMSIGSQSATFSGDF